MSSIFVEAWGKFVSFHALNQQFLDIFTPGRCKSPIFLNSFKTWNAPGNISAEMVKLKKTRFKSVQSNKSIMILRHIIYNLRAKSSAQRERFFYLDFVNCVHVCSRFSPKCSTFTEECDWFSKISQNAQNLCSLDVFQNRSLKEANLL